MIHRQTVDFSSLLLGTGQFLPQCSWLNANGKLYISGGLASDGPSSLFLQFDIFNFALTRLPDMLSARCSHSMLYHDNFIYVVGGTNNNSCEKFDLKTSKWVKLNNLNLDERINPILFAKKNYLYAFFGMKGGEYIDIVERLNLKTLKSKWEIVAYKNPENLNLKMLGCGIMDVSENEIYMFGGKSTEGVKNDCVSFDFNTLAFSSVDMHLDDGTYFMESKLMSLGNNTYGQYNMYKDDILKLQLS